MSVRVELRLGGPVVQFLVAGVVKATIAGIAQTEPVRGRPHLIIVVEDPPATPASYVLNLVDEHLAVESARVVKLQGELATIAELIGADPLDDVPHLVAGLMQRLGDLESEDMLVDEALAAWEAIPRDGSYPRLHRAIDALQLARSK